MKHNASDCTHAVGQMTANPFGLSDMHGNVWEWVLDGWDPMFYSQFREKTAIDPYTSGFVARVFRGGNWNSSSSECRSAFRLAFDPSQRPNYIGFRVALSVQEVRKALQSQPVNATNATPVTNGNGRGWLPFFSAIQQPPMEVLAKRRNSNETFARFRLDTISGPRQLPK